MKDSTETVGVIASPAPAVIWRPDHNRDLPTRRLPLEPLDRFAGRPPHDLLELLGELPAHGDRALRPKDLHHLT